MSSSKKQEMEEEGGFVIPGVPFTLYPTSDPKRVKVKMSDLGFKTYTEQPLYVTQPYMSPETLSLLSRYNSKKKTTILHGFGRGIARKRPTGSLKGSVPYSDETLVSSRNPDPCLRYVAPSYQFASDLPPQMSYEEHKAAAAAINANLAASTAAIKARSTIPIAAAAAAAAPPAMSHYLEDPSKMIASDAAPTSSEGQAEAEPVLIHGRYDTDPSAADSSATGSPNN